MRTPDSQPSGGTAGVWGMGNRLVETPKRVRITGIADGGSQQEVIWHMWVQGLQAMARIALTVFSLLVTSSVALSVVAPWIIHGTDVRWNVR